MNEPKSLEEKQREMRENATLEKKRKRERDWRRKDRLRQKLEQIAGPGSEVRVEVVKKGEPVSANADIKDVLGRLKHALKALDGLTPEQVHERITALTHLLRMKLQLQVNECIDKLDASDPDTRDNALEVIKTLMPFINTMTELDVKMQAVLGLAEGKGRLLGVQNRQPAALPAVSADSWEKQFSDTLTNRSLN